MIENPEFYEDCEKAIKQRLEPLTEEPLELEVEIAPDSGKDYKPSFDKGKITIGYFKSIFEEVDSQKYVGVTVQEETLIFEIMCTSRTRTGVLGVIRLIRYAMAFLLSYEPNGCARMFLHEQGYSSYDEKEQTWTYTLQMGAKAIAVPLPEEIEPNLLEMISFSNNLEETIEIPSE